MNEGEILVHIEWIRSYLIDQLHSFTSGKRVLRPVNPNIYTTLTFNRGSLYSPGIEQFKEHFFYSIALSAMDSRFEFNESSFSVIKSYLIRFIPVVDFSVKEIESKNSNSVKELDKLAANLMVYFLRINFTPSSLYPEIMTDDLNAYEKAILKWIAYCIGNSAKCMTHNIIQDVGTAKCVILLLSKARPDLIRLSRVSFESKLSNHDILNNWKEAEVALLIYGVRKPNQYELNDRLCLLCFAVDLYTCMSSMFKVAPMAPLQGSYDTNIADVSSTPVTNLHRVDMLLEKINQLAKKTQITPIQPPQIVTVVQPKIVSPPQNDEFDTHLAIIRQQQQQLPKPLEKKKARKSEDFEDDSISDYLKSDSSDEEAKKIPKKILQKGYKHVPQEDYMTTSVKTKADAPPPRISIKSKQKPKYDLPESQEREIFNRVQQLMKQDKENESSTKIISKPKKQESRKEEKLYQKKKLSRLAREQIKPKRNQVASYSEEEDEETDNSSCSSLLDNAKHIKMTSSPRRKGDKNEGYYEIHVKRKQLKSQEENPKIENIRNQVNQRKSPIKISPVVAFDSQPKSPPKTKIPVRSSKKPIPQPIMFESSDDNDMPTESYIDDYDESFDEEINPNEEVITIREDTKDVEPKKKKIETKESFGKPHTSIISVGPPVDQNSPSAIELKRPVRLEISKEQVQVEAIAKSKLVIQPSIDIQRIDEDVQPKNVTKTEHKWISNIKNRVNQTTEQKNNKQTKDPVINKQKIEQKINKQTKDPVASKQTADKINDNQTKEPILSNKAEEKPMIKKAEEQIARESTKSDDQQRKSTDKPIKKVDKDFSQEYSYDMYELSEESFHGNENSSYGYYYEEESTNSQRTKEEQPVSKEESLKMPIKIASPQIKSKMPKNPSPPPQEEEPDSDLDLIEEEEEEEEEINDDEPPVEEVKDQQSTEYEYEYVDEEEEEIKSENNVEPDDKNEDLLSEPLVEEEEEEEEEIPEEPVVIKKIAPERESIDSFLETEMKVQVDSSSSMKNEEPPKKTYRPPMVANQILKKMQEKIKPKIAPEMPDIIVEKYTRSDSSDDGFAQDPLMALADHISSSRIMQDDSDSMSDGEKPYQRNESQTASFFSQQGSGIKKSFVDSDSDYDSDDKDIEHDDLMTPIKKQDTNKSSSSSSFSANNTQKTNNEQENAKLSTILKSNIQSTVNSKTNQKVNIDSDDDENEEESGDESAFVGTVPKFSNHDIESNMERNEISNNNEESNLKISTLELTKQNSQTSKQISDLQELSISIPETQTLNSTNNISELSLEKKSSHSFDSRESTNKSSIEQVESTIKDEENEPLSTIKQANENTEKSNFLDTEQNSTLSNKESMSTLKLSSISGLKDTGKEDTFKASQSHKSTLDTTNIPSLQDKESALEPKQEESLLDNISTLKSIEEDTIKAEETIEIEQHDEPIKLEISTKDEKELHVVQTQGNESSESSESEKEETIPFAPVNLSFGTLQATKKEKNDDESHDSIIEFNGTNSLSISSKNQESVPSVQKSTDISELAISSVDAEKKSENVDDEISMKAEQSLSISKSNASSSGKQSKDQILSENTSSHSRKKSSDISEFNIPSHHSSNNEKSIEIKEEEEEEEINEDDDHKAFNLSFNTLKTSKKQQSNHGFDSSSSNEETMEDKPKNFTITGLKSQQQPGKSTIALTVSSVSDTGLQTEVKEDFSLTNINSTLDNQPSDIEGEYRLDASLPSFLSKKSDIIEDEEQLPDLFEEEEEEEEEIKEQYSPIKPIITDDDDDDFSMKSSILSGVTTPTKRDKNSSDDDIFSASDDEGAPRKSLNNVSDNEELSSSEQEDLFNSVVTLSSDSHKSSQNNSLGLPSTRKTQEIHASSSDQVEVSQIQKPQSSENSGESKPFKFNSNIVSSDNSIFGNGSSSSPSRSDSMRQGITIPHSPPKDESIMKATVPDKTINFDPKGLTFGNLNRDSASSINSFTRMEQEAMESNSSNTNIQTLTTENPVSDSTINTSSTEKFDSGGSSIRPNIQVPPTYMASDKFKPPSIQVALPKAAPQKIQSPVSIEDKRVSFLPQFTTGRSSVLRSRDKPFIPLPQQKPPPLPAPSSEDKEMISEYLNSAHGQEKNLYEQLTGTEEKVLCHILPHALTLTQTQVYDHISSELNISRRDPVAHKIVANITKFMNKGASEMKNIDLMGKTQTVDLSAVSNNKSSSESDSDSDMYF